jgi:quinol monooxygenase YgiN
MIIVSGTLKTTDERLDALAAPMSALIETTRGEAGCLVYAFARDVSEPGLVRIYEEWESREALAAHSKAAHVASWHAALAGAGGADVALQLVEVASVEAFG